MILRDSKAVATRKGASTGAQFTGVDKDVKSLFRHMKNSSQSTEQQRKANSSQFFHKIQVGINKKEKQIKDKLGKMKQGLIQQRDGKEFLVIDNVGPSEPAVVSEHHALTDEAKQIMWAKIQKSMNESKNEEKEK